MHCAGRGLVNTTQSKRLWDSQMKGEMEMRSGIIASCYQHFSLQYMYWYIVDAHLLISEVNTLISWIQMVVHNRQGENSIYINLIQRLFEALRREWRDPAAAFQIWAQCLVRAKREGIINRLCVLQLANSCWALRYSVRLTMFKEAGRAASGSEDVPGSRSTPDESRSSLMFRN